jgi:hypothetical protein
MHLGPNVLTICPQLDINEILEEVDAIGGAEGGIGGSFGVGHHAEDVALLVADTGDIIERAVRILASVAE